MTAKLFWVDPYRTACDTAVASVRGDVGRIRLRRKNVGRDKERIEVRADPPADAGARPREAR